MKRNIKVYKTLMAVTAFFGVLSVTQVAGAAERNTTVFISDLHMNVDASYAWLVKHAGDLESFLKEVNARDDVAELVILGDLVDDWVSPLGTTPQSFADVLNAATNAGIVAALGTICDRKEIDVTYVVGNHDMLSFRSENQAVLKEAFPCMQILSDPPGLGAYTRDEVIWAEHGHRYCLFNAPDTWSRSGGHLPMGYFISRLAADKAAATGQVITTPELLDEFLKAPAASIGYEGSPEVGGIFDDALVFAAFNAIALWSGNGPLDRFTMNGLDGFDSDPSVEGVAVTYDTIFSNWPARQDRVSPEAAVWNDVGMLNSAANLLFEMPASLKDQYPFTPRIVLFGHTHEALFQYHSGGVDTIYANTGTWIDKKDITWVEIETTDEDGKRRRYEVSLWFYGETSPRQSGAITAAPATAGAGKSWADAVRGQLLHRR